MTLPGGFAELACEPSVLNRARSNNGSGFVGRCIRRRASAALRRGSAPARRLTRTTVTSLSGRDGDICIGRTQAQIVENWVGFIETYVDRGIEPDEILKEKIPVTAQDPYPIG